MGTTYKIHKAIQKNITKYFVKKFGEIWHWCVKAWELVTWTWEREIAGKNVRLTPEAWQLRSMHPTYTTNMLKLLMYIAYYISMQNILYNCYNSDITLSTSDNDLTCPFLDKWSRIFTRKPIYPFLGQPFFVHGDTPSEIEASLMSSTAKKALHVIFQNLRNVLRL